MADERARDLLRQRPGERTVEHAGDLGRRQHFVHRFFERPTPCACGCPCWEESDPSGRVGKPGASRRPSMPSREVSPAEYASGHRASEMSRPQRKPALPVELSSVLVGDIMVGSFYDPDLDERCAFEELVSFHGGIGGLQTRFPSSSIRSIPGFRWVRSGRGERARRPSRRAGAGSSRVARTRTRKWCPRRARLRSGRATGRDRDGAAVGSSGSRAINRHHYRKDGTMAESTSGTPVLDLLASMTADSIEASSLDPEALIALVRHRGARGESMPPTISYLMNLEAASELDIDAEQIRGVLAAIAPIVGNGARRIGDREDRRGSRGCDRGRGVRGREQRLSAETRPIDDGTTRARSAGLWLNRVCPVTDRRCRVRQPPQAPAPDRLIRRRADRSPSAARPSASATRRDRRTRPAAPRPSALRSRCSWERA